MERFLEIEGTSAEWSIETPQDPNNQVFLIGKDAQGSKGYMAVRVEELTKDGILRGVSMLFECLDFTLVEAPTSKEALDFINEKWPLPKPSKHPLGDLHLIKYDCHSQMSPATFFNNYIKFQQGEIVVWDAMPIMDEVWILFYLPGTFTIPAPTEQFCYRLATPEDIQSNYKPYIL